MAFSGGIPHKLEDPQSNSLSRIVAHSFILGKGARFQVRDLIFEAILERLKDDLANKDAHSSSTRIATEWFNYWYETPPGCKRLTIEIPEQDVRERINEVLVAIIDTLPSGGELLIAAEQFRTILASK
ncbi:MAG: hypothetical protein QM755_03290 [Luteolibacter sp.]